MNSEQLQKARDFEKKYLPYIPEEERPEYHVTGTIGWINDPNGFSTYQGWYHLFFQYHPYSTKWGPMHWGHVRTRDFIHWERLPAAIAPDQPYDKDGCFSGGAVEMPDGRQMLMYTGVRSVRQENGMVVNYQTQCVAVGDGVDYEKYEGNPVLTAEHLPEGGSALDFRDPKLWREDGRYYCVTGNRPADGSGSVLLFESDDGFHWRADGVLSENQNQYGRMWECPDFFSLDGKQVLLVSPQETSAIGLEFHAGYSSVCMIGAYDRKAHTLTREQVQAIDYGLDFYAPQTLEAYDGRRIMVAWMQNWETANCQPREARLFGEMTLPRELWLKDGRLFQAPVRELERCRRDPIFYRNVNVSDEVTLQGIRGRVVDMTVTVRPGNRNNLYHSFRMSVAKDGEHATSVRFKPETNTIRIDRTRSGFPHDIVNIRDFPVRSENGEIRLRVLLDRYSMELFVNDGEQAASVMLYTPQTADSISFFAEGMVLIDVEKYDLCFHEAEEPQTA